MSDVLDEWEKVCDALGPNVTYRTEGEFIYEATACNGFPKLIKAHKVMREALLRLSNYGLMSAVDEKGNQLGHGIALGQFVSEAIAASDAIIKGEK